MIHLLPKPELTQEFHDNLADYNRVGFDRARAGHNQWMANCNTVVAGRTPPDLIGLIEFVKVVQDQDRRMILFPFTNSFIALFLII